MRVMAADGLVTRAEVLGALQHLGPSSSTAVAEELGISAITAAAHLERLRVRGQASRAFGDQGLIYEAEPEEEPWPETRDSRST